MDHVENVHLRKQAADQRIICHHPICKAQALVLNNVMHYKNHVQVTQGISLRAFPLLIFSSCYFLLQAYSIGNYKDLNSAQIVSVSLGIDGNVDHWHLRLLVSQYNS